MDAAAPSEAAPSEAATSAIEVQRALSTTATIFTEVDALVKKQQADAADMAVSLKQLKAWRTLARRANAAIARNAKTTHVALDRLSVEIAMLKVAIKNECIDKEAHLSRVLSKMRESDATEGGNDAPVPPLASGGGSSSNDQNARRVDRAHAAALKVEHAVETLAAVPDRNLHGAPTIAYLASQNALATAVSAAPAAATAS